MITFVTPKAIKWYQAQIPEVRALLGRPMDAQIGGIQAIINDRLIPDEQVSNYLKVFKYGRTPVTVFGEAAIDKLERAADLVIPLPFSPEWANRRGDPTSHIGDCWYELPEDATPVGSIDLNGIYEKFSCNASESMNPTYYADWSLDFGERMLRCWVRVK